MAVGGDEQAAVRAIIENIRLFLTVPPVAAVQRIFRIHRQIVGFARARVNHHTPLAADAAAPNGRNVIATETDFVVTRIFNVAADNIPPARHNRRVMMAFIHFAAGIFGKIIMRLIRLAVRGGGKQNGSEQQGFHEVLLVDGRDFAVIFSS